MFNKLVMINVFKSLLLQAKKSYDEFNTADGKIGDGDLGITILNGLEEINNNLDKFKDDLSINFMLCSQAFVKKSGSSFGTLIAFAFMNISKDLNNKSTCDHDDIINMINSLGATPLEELYIVSKRVNEIFSKKDLEIIKSYVGRYATSLEMAGMSISVLRLDDDLKNALLDHSECPFWIN